MDNRMFDFAGYYERIANELPNDCKVVEVGVADGASSLFLAKALHERGKTFKLYMIDSLDYGKKKQLSEIIKNVMLSGLQDSIEIMPFDSLNASCFFNDGSLDFVFLDSSHKYADTKQEIRCWYPKLLDERILAGHDYFSEENKEVRQAVDELIPETIKREPIVSRYFNEQLNTEMDWVDYFEEEKLLFTEQTEKGNGIWYVAKRFYFKP
jgi:cephalosporin hydroxylase